MLIDYGAGAGSCVALLLPRCAEAIIAILGCKERGGVSAHRPRTPGRAHRVHARRRRPLAVITTTGLADRLDGHDVAVIDINDPRSTPTPTPTCPARPPMTSPT
ncbi:AMP-binding enzyme family protein [Mycobacterium xenopi 4042]|uniref:AMP-binding enzyme family protein n=1 Tax=Mycobacterium xenopi 4042 TaxID=1299334 RepID=X8DCD5_MYCXE|nr:AMP-binding enzyme family protein [Mycobacterium xenopi 4042]